MSRIEIPFNGISTTSTYHEGDFIELVNLRKKNGALHPVSPRKTVRELGNSYTLLFVHRNESYEHLIGVRAGKLYWITRENLTDSETLIMDVAGTVSITQTGNMLNVLTSDGIKYALWKENKYIPIIANIQSDVSIYTDIKKRDGLPETFVFYADMISRTDDNLRYETAKGLFAKQKRILNEKGLLTGITIAITAIELFDGSIIYTSNPVILMQSNDAYKRYKNIGVTEKDTGTNFVFDFENNPALFNSNNSELYEATNSNFLQEPEWENEQYTSYTGAMNFRAGIPGRTSAGTVVNNIPLLMLTNAVHETPRPRVIASGNELYVKINNQFDASLSDVVKSINVYITPEVSIYDYEVIAKTLRGYIYLHENYTYDAVNTCPRLKSNKEVHEELFSQSNFYLVREISFDEVNTNIGQPILIDLKGKLGDNLYTQQALPVSTYMHTLKAEKQLVYNSRLHLFDYSTNLFSGYPLSNYKYLPGTGHLPNKNTLENFNWWIEITISTTSGTSKVVSSQFNTPITDLNPLLSYPDARATSMKFYISGTISENVPGIGTVISYYKYEKEFKLTKHKYHNFAYYISPDLKPIEINATFTSIAYTPPVLNEVNATEVFHNGIKVSATNNPLYFPPEHSYQAGSGTILHAATNAMNVSDRNFGMYPLFVATTQGWFMMNIASSETAYSSITPITSSEVPLNSLLCSTPHGVIFIAKRGLYLINANGTTLITPQVEEVMPTVNIQGHDAIMKLLPESDIKSYDNVADDGFRDFLTRVKAIMYDAGENEIIIVSSTVTELNWVLNLDSKMMYKTTEAIDYQIQNTYPQLYVISGNKQKDYSQEETADTAVSLLLRPIACGTRDIKKLDRVMMSALLRGVKNNGLNKSAIVVWQSDDNVNFTTTRGMNLLPGNYRDYDMGLFPRTKNRWFTFGFRGILSSESRINGVELNINKEYDNEKMR